MKTQLLSKANILIFLFFTCKIFSQWASNSTVNNAICSTIGTQFQSVQISDGNGGSIIAWSDNRSGNFDIYAQHINANGILQWTTNGKPICSATGGQRFPAIISDNQNGAIICWTDERNSSVSGSDIYAQRISATGVVLWTSDGVAICSATNAQQNNSLTSLTSNANGGAIIVWEDRRNGLDWNIYSQSINNLGATQWTLDGNVVCNAPLTQKNAEIISAESGNSIIVWEDSRVAIATYDIYALKLNSIGATGTPNGVAVCSAADNQLEPKLVTDGNFGAIITWQDRRNSANYDIYAQRFTTAGIAWAIDGVAICTSNGDQALPKICSDAANGAYIVWGDDRAASSDIYIQKVNANGTTLSGTNGSSIISTAQNQTAPSITSDDSGGAIVCWTDYRNNVASADIYCQRLNNSGFADWNGNIIIGGVAVCTEASDQSFATSIVTTGNGGAIVTWQDSRNSGTNLQDIYSQLINSGGTLTTKINNLEANQLVVYPNPSTNGLFSIQCKNVIQELTAFDVLGKQINIERINESFKINASSGIYNLRIKDSNGIIQNKKLIIK